MGAISDFLWNAATGTLSSDQKAALQQQETQGIIQAGGDPSQAASQAASDVTTVLTQNNADPSQASIFNNPGLSNLFKYVEYAAIAVAAYFVLKLVLNR